MLMSKQAVHRTIIFISFFLSAGALGGGPMNQAANPTLIVDQSRVNNSVRESTRINSNNKTHIESTSATGGNSTSGAQSNSRSGSSVSGDSYSGGNNLSAAGGRSDSSATGGSSNAAGGSAVAGDSTSQSGGNTISGGNTANTTSVEYSTPVATAATVFAGQCQSGLSGQLSDGGFSVVNTRQFCDLVDAANLAWQAYQRAIVLAKVKCVGVCTEKYASVTREADPEQMARAEEYLAAYHHNVNSALALVRSTETAGKIDRVSTLLMKPAAIILALIFVL